jgi:hypothetical protein
LFFAAPNYSTQAGSTFEVKNNILYAPNASQAFVRGSTSSAITNASNNTVSLQTSPMFSTTPPSAASHFTPATGSYANGTGTNVKVHSDFHGVPTHSQPDMGAVAH